MLHVSHPASLRPGVLARYTLFFGACVVSLPCIAQEPRDWHTHALVPGVRLRDPIRNDWPRTFHDEQLTGFSPLTCGLHAAPRIAHTAEFGGSVQTLRVVTTKDGTSRILLSDGRLRMVDPDGTVRWVGEANGTVEFFGDLYQNNTDVFLLQAGPDLVVLDGETGKVVWKHRFLPEYVTLRVDVADALPKRAGLEAAIFLHGDGQGFLLGFRPDGDPEVLWERTVVVPGEWPERQDHGTDVQFDLSHPERPLVWNIRHHRMRSFDVADGEQVSSLVYKIDGEHQRNYGPWAVGRDREGRTTVALISSTVQVHSHAARVSENGTLELAWQNDYGYVFENPDIRVKPIVLGDANGDGTMELVYAVRDPAQAMRSFLRVRDAGTGEIIAELPDHWSIGASYHPGEQPPWVFHTTPAPDGTTPDRGPLESYRLGRDGRLELLARFAYADPMLPLVLGSTGSFEIPKKEVGLYLRQHQGDEDWLRRYSFRHGAPVLVSAVRAGAWLRSGLVGSGAAADGSEFLLATNESGRLEARDWGGERLWELALAGARRPTLSAADLNGDGRAELVAATGGDRVRVLALDSGDTLAELFSRPFRARAAGDRQSPLLYDLEGTGRLCLVAPGATRSGNLAVRAFRYDGALLWERELSTTSDEGGTVVAWNGGAFLPGPRAALAISVEKRSYTGEGTYLLDGPTGEILWHRTLYGSGIMARPYRPQALPVAFDFDRDGLEDIGMDLYSYMAWLRGSDGGFVFVRHTRNIRAEGALAVGHLQHSFVPLFEHPSTKDPHWFVPLGGYGPIGLMEPGPAAAVWKEELEEVIPVKVGMVDVDGDGRLEIGYTHRRGSTFRCQDVFTGTIEWELELPTNAPGPVITADVDGDGKGEFLLGRYCVGTDDSGQGELRWESPISLDWAIIADFDGDGIGELACPAPGKVHILRPR